MKANRFWKMLSIALVVALFSIGTAIHRQADGRPLLPAAHGQVIGPAITQDAQDVLITASADGRTLYIWTFGDWNLEERRLPVFQRVVRTT